MSHVSLVNSENIVETPFLEAEPTLKLQIEKVEKYIYSLPLSTARDAQKYRAISKKLLIGAFCLFGAGAFCFLGVRNLRFFVCAALVTSCVSLYYFSRAKTAVDAFETDQQRHDKELDCVFRAVFNDKVNKFDVVVGSIHCTNREELINALNQNFPGLSINEQFQVFYACCQAPYLTTQQVNEANPGMSVFDLPDTRKITIMSGKNNKPFIEISSDCVLGNHSENGPQLEGKREILLTIDIGNGTLESNSRREELNGDETSDSIKAFLAGNYAKMPASFKEVKSQYYVDGATNEKVYVVKDNNFVKNNDGTPKYTILSKTDHDEYGEYTIEYITIDGIDHELTEE